MAIEIRGWGLENDHLTLARSPSGQQVTRAVRDSIREEVPGIIEATLKEWLSTYEKKQRAWLQAMFNEQQATSQNQLVEDKINELMATMDRYQRTLDGVLGHTASIVKETIEHTMTVAVTEAMVKTPQPVQTMQTVEAQRAGSSAGPGAPEDSKEQDAATPQIASRPSMSRTSRLTDEVELEEEEEEEHQQGNFMHKAVSRLRDMRKAGRSFYRQTREEYLHERYLAARMSGNVPQVNRSLYFFVNSRLFEGFMMLVIVLHVVYMIVDTNIAFETVIEAGGRKAGLYSLFFESIFFFSYLTELVLKLIVEREFFFKGPARTMNILDLILLVAGAIDIIGLILVADGVMSVMSLKAIRVFRMVGLTRTRRLFLLSDDMQLLMKSLAACAVSLVGPFCLLIGYFLIMSLWIVPYVQTYIANNKDQLSAEETDKLKEMFGSVQKTIFSLYQSVTGGTNWIPVLIPLAKIDWWVTGVPFIIYHFVYTFLMVNVVLCMFLGKIVLFSLSQSQSMKHDQKRQDIKDLEWILHWCEQSYGAEDTINYQEFLRMMKRFELHEFFKLRGVKLEDVRMLFRAFAPEPIKEDSTREWDFNIGRKDFFEACMRLKHEVSTTDVLASNALIARSLDKQRRVCEDTVAKMGALEEQVRLAMQKASAAMRAMPY